MNKNEIQLRLKKGASFPFQAQKPVWEPAGAVTATRGAPAGRSYLPLATSSGLSSTTCAVTSRGYFFPPMDRT